MDEEQVKILLEKYKAGIATEEEKAFLESWYAWYKAQPGVSYTQQERLEDADEVWQLIAQENRPKQIKLWK